MSYATACQSPVYFTDLCPVKLHVFPKIRVIFPFFKEFTPCQNRQILIKKQKHYHVLTDIMKMVAFSYKNKQQLNIIWIPKPCHFNFYKSEINSQWITQLLQKKSSETKHQLQTKCHGRIDTVCKKKHLYHICSICMGESGSWATAVIF
jgi:hypothetical protein